MFSVNIILLYIVRLASDNHWQLPGNGCYSVSEARLENTVWSKGREALEKVP
jgi:hypothetical protein